MSSESREVTRGRRLSTEKDLAKSLAETLGSLYRVSIVAENGEVEECFGEIASDRISQTDIALPKSSKSLRIEVDGDAVAAAQRVAMALAPSLSSGPATSGGFTHVNSAIHELISMAEAQIRLPIARMSRRQKQQVVRFLDEHGAFNLRKSVETVADMLGVSRFTVYNYLDSSRGS